MSWPPDWLLGLIAAALGQVAFYTVSWPLDLLAGLIAAALGLVAFYAVWPHLVRPLFRVMLFPRYRFRVCGLEHLPRSGPVLVVANHITWLDGFFLVATCPRRGKCLVNAAYLKFPPVRILGCRAGLIPVPTAGAHAHRAVIEAARASLERGEALGIFPEAQVSRNGLLGSFYRGIEVILAGNENVPVVPVYLDNLWGSIFSHSDGRFFRKWPQGFRRTICVAYGPSIPPPRTVYSVRQALLSTSVRAYELRSKPERPLETLNLSLPHIEHPTLGLLAASTANHDEAGIRQTGNKPGSVGHPVPGVALRVVDDSGQPLTECTVGRLQALIAGKPDWVDTGLRGSIDRDGFVQVI